MIDAKQEYSDAQALGALSSGGSSLISTDVQDVESSRAPKNAFGTSIDPDIGQSTFNVNVNVALVGAAATVRVDLVTKDADASISSGGTVLASIVIPALSASGYKAGIELKAGQTCKRYLGALYTAVGAGLTSASIDCWLSMETEVRGVSS